MNDKNGKPLAIGDRVRTADGRVITIAGAINNVREGKHGGKGRGTRTDEVRSRDPVDDRRHGDLGNVVGWLKSLLWALAPRFHAWPRTLPCGCVINEYGKIVQKGPRCEVTSGSHS
jgi:hypothetical protein